MSTRFVPRLLFLTAVTCLVAALAAAPAFGATQAEIEAAVNSGIAYLASAQQPDGSWTSAYGEHVSNTAFALIKLQERANELGVDPFSPAYQYSPNVIAGWQYIFAVGDNVVPVSGAQDHTASGGGMDSADSDGDGLYLGFWSPAVGPHHSVYTTGLVLYALHASGNPLRDATPYGYPASFGAICQDAADWMCAAQGDLAQAEGGWGYDLIDNANYGQGSYGWTDNSNAGYATLGLAAAQDFGATVPAWVKTELNKWFPNIQDPVNGDYNDGGSHYTAPLGGWINELKTGNLLFELTFAGSAPTSQRFVDALDYIERNWQTGGQDPGWGYGGQGNWQATFCLMKGLEYSNVSMIDLNGDNVAEHDWFDELSTVICSQQQPGGYWVGSMWGAGDYVLDTCWALLTLEKSTPPPQPQDPWYPNDPVISEDLVAQQDTICIPAMVKIHPTLQLAIDKESLSYYDLNPATNRSADLTFTVQVKSNLPFRQQVTMTPFNFTPNGVPGDVLQSYNYENGQWVLRSWDASIDGPEPGTGDTIPVDEQSVFITTVNGRTGELVRSEEQVGADGVYPGDGSVIGDINNHTFEGQVRWHIGPIKWCDTAGYYVGQLCVTVYQN